MISNTDAAPLACSELRPLPSFSNRAKPSSYVWLSRTKCATPVSNFEWTFTPLEHVARGAAEQRFLLFGGACLVGWLKLLGSTRSGDAPKLVTAVKRCLRAKEDVVEKEGIVVSNSGVATGYVRSRCSRAAVLLRPPIVVHIREHLAEGWCHTVMRLAFVQRTGTTLGLLVAWTSGCASGNPVVADHALKVASEFTSEPRRPERPEAVTNHGVDTVEGTCSASSDYYQRREELPRDLEVFIQVVQSEADAVCVGKIVERYFPEVARLRPPPTAPQHLRTWWRAVGQSAVLAEFGLDRVVVLPEAPRVIDEPGALSRLSPLLCTSETPSCGAEARGYLAEVERELALLGEVGMVQDQLDRAKKGMPIDDAGRATECERLAVGGETQAAYANWRRCIEALVPIVARFPENNFRLPESGKLVTTRRGYWHPCVERSAYSIDTGAVLSRFSCRRDEPTGTLDRWRLARGSRTMVQHLALIAALKDEVREGPARAVSFRLPDGITAPEGAWHGHRIPAWSMVSDGMELSYSVYGVLDAPLTEQLYINHERRLIRRFLVDNLEALSESAAPVCAAETDKDWLEPLVVAVLRETIGADAVVRDAEVRNVIDGLTCPRAD